MIATSGLLEWWSNFVNRTDLVRVIENEPPVKPTMSGNIQILFFMLSFGIAVGQIFLILELHEYILKLLYCVVILAPQWVFKNLKIHFLALIRSN